MAEGKTTLIPEPDEKASLSRYNVLCCHIQNSKPSPPQYSDSTWRRSRYIIDNRKNVLFSKKPLTALLQHPQEYHPKESTFSHESFKQNLFPVVRYHKDLTAEASISEPKFYQKYGENSLQKKIIKSYKIPGGLGNHPNEYKFNVGVFQNQKNTSEVIEPQNFIQNEDEVLIDVNSKTVTTTEKMPSWEPRSALVSMPPTITISKEKKEAQIGSQTIQELEVDSSTTASNPWELTHSKTEEGNQIDNTNEKHVYETRIETVSYHQEVIFNPPKKQNWYQEEPEKKPKNYEPAEENYEKPEKNYENPEENYEEPEKNYELNEAVNVMSEGTIYPGGNEESQNKFGYVVEGTNYRKYRVEERTADGFIVGEYGVVSHDDGSLRGVRYTAEGNTNPQLIYETLIKFLSL